jgi:hypothetical protein
LEVNPIPNKEFTVADVTVPDTVPPDFDGETEDDDPAEEES